MQRAIITVLGEDRTGIIAAVTSRLAEYGVNIRDITQTILQDYFTMIMLVEIFPDKTSFEEIKVGLKEVAKDLNMSIHIQHEDIFKSVHRI